jgi:hypothetical protein
VRWVAGGDSPGPRSDRGRRRRALALTGGQRQNLEMPRRRRRRAVEKPFVLALCFIAVFFVALGALYLAVPASSLPRSVPGRDPNVDARSISRALVCFGIAAIVAFIAWSDSRIRKRHRRATSRVHSRLQRPIGSP